MGIVKNSLLAVAVVVAATTFSGAARASLLIEPHVGYILGGNADYNGADVSYNGPDYGARLGGQWLGVMAGLDYTHSTFAADFKTTAGSGELERKRDMIGIFAGYNFPILLRAWATYYFSAKTSNTQTNSFGTNGNYTKGNATELGIGFTGLPFLSLNLSYRMSTHDENQAGSINPELETKEIVLGVSAPFTLL